MGAPKENSIKVEVEIECALDAALLNEVEWFTLSGGTPRKERNHRPNIRTKARRIVDLCTWIGMKGYQSITGLYSDMLKEPKNRKEESEGALAQEVKTLKRLLEEVVKKQARENDIFHEEMKKMMKKQARENDIHHEEMKKMMTKIEILEGKLRDHNSSPKPKVAPPPPPPLPPPPPPPPPPQPLLTTMSKLSVRSHTIPRRGSAPPRITGPRLTITPEDIANVKLRKTKENPVRSKPPVQASQQPLVTQQMLQSTRAKLGRTRPVAASTPKQQLSELEKCLLQESSVSSLYRRRVARNSFRSAEELRVRPYPTARAARSPRSPRSPRASSLSRGKPISPLKLPNLAK